MRIILFNLFCLFAMSTGINSQDMWDMNYTKLAEGVYTAYHSDPLYLVEGNVLIIINKNDVVVFDGSGAQPIARNIINKIKELTNNPVSTVIISHGHEDHIRGLQEYVNEYPDVEIIARTDTREYMDTAVRERIESFEERQANNEEAYKNEVADMESSGKFDKKVIDWYKFTYFKAIPAQQELYKSLKLQLPTLTFEGSELVLERETRTIKILYLGYGKTQSDLLLYLPKEKILATGDIVTAPVPYGFSRQPESWLRVLMEIDSMDADIIVPGHGAVMYDKTFIQNEIEMIKYVHNDIDSLYHSGTDTESIKDALNISQFKDQFCNGDPLAEFLFDRYYFSPHIQNRINQLENK